MLINVLGVGDAFSRKHYRASVLIKVGQKYIITDCPPLIGRALLENTPRGGEEVTLGHISGFILTHLHLDHSGGLEEVGYLRELARKGNFPPELSVPSGPLHGWPSAPPKPTIWCIPEVGEAIKEHFKGTIGRVTPQRPGIEAFFNIVPVKPAKEWKEILPGIYLRMHPTVHSVPCGGFLLRYEDSTLGWSSDTAFDEDYETFLQEADLVIHEANYGGLHTPLEKLMELPEDTRKKYVLIHYPDAIDSLSVPLRCLKEGDRITL